MLKSQRDTIAVALKKLGYSMNTRNIEELERAKEELIKQKPLVYSYLGDEVRDILVGEDAAIAVVWSGDAVEMIRENDYIENVIPKEGIKLWFVDMIIPKGQLIYEYVDIVLYYLTLTDITDHT